MLSKLFRRSPSYPLHDFIVGVTPERMAAICEGSVDNPDIVPITIGMLIISTAGHFSRTDVPRVKGPFAKVSKDVIAFEAIAFTAFSIREYYEPLNSDYYNEEVSDGFKDGFGFCCAIVKRELGSSYRDIFDRRLMEYAQANDRGQMQGAAEAFRLNLQSIMEATTPHANYGGLSLDLSDTLGLMVAANAFAATMPKRAAESLHLINDHYGYF